MYPIDMVDANNWGSVEEAILPLYSSNSLGRFVPAKSGLNQWNAGGRTRQFGECYISIPASFRAKYVDFFPPRDVTFSLELPSGRQVKAKVCQQGGKALMTSPNTEMCNWLFPLIDGTIEKSIRRFVSKNPYQYQDLKLAGFDSVVVSRDTSTDLYKIRLAEFGAFEQQYLASER